MKNEDVEKAINTLRRVQDAGLDIQDLINLLSNIDTVINEEENLRKRISNVLMELGAPVETTGYNYLAEAIQIAYNDPTKLQNITKFIYPEIGIKFGVEAKNVGKKIMNAIHYTCFHGNDTAWDKIFTGRDFAGKNKKFIATICEYLRKSKT